MAGGNKNLSKIGGYCKLMYLRRRKMKRFYEKRSLVFYLFRLSDNCL